MSQFLFFPNDRSAQLCSFLLRYLQPAIVDVWRKEQAAILETMGDSDAFLATDMRADSMGHSAKFGCYSVCEVNQGKVLHIELIQVML